MSAAGGDAPQVRPARDFRFRVPTSAEVEARLKALVEDRESPAEVAAWAWEFIRYDDPELYPPVDDPVVWKALDRLAGADLSASPDELLHGVEDFEQWLRELQRSTPPVP